MQEEGEVVLVWFLACGVNGRENFHKKNERERETDHTSPPTTAHTDMYPCFLLLTLCVSCQGPKAHVSHVLLEREAPPSTETGDQEQESRIQRQLVIQDSIFRTRVPSTPTKPKSSLLLQKTVVTTFVRFRSLKLRGRVHCSVSFQFGNVEKLGETMEMYSGSHRGLDGHRRLRTRISEELGGVRSVHADADKVVVGRTEGGGKTVFRGWRS